MLDATSLYLHVPFCRHLCNYCDFYKVKYSNSLELESFSQFLFSSQKEHQDFLMSHQFQVPYWDTIYLGGGTPSLWGEKGADHFQKLIQMAPLQSNYEFTMEIDPGTWSEKLLAAWQKIGLNRISVGTQSLNPDFLKVFDRAHSIDETLHFLAYLKEKSWNYSLDFLIGAPYSQEKKRNIESELDLLLGFNPKHISLYILNARSKYPHISAMPDDEYISEEYLFVSKYLTSKGFHHYEVSNFSLPGFESRHNQKYWRSETVLGLGPSAVGYLRKSKNEALRYKWKVSEPKFQLEVLKSNEIDLEDLYLKLRTSEGIELQNLPSELVKKWNEKSLGSILGQRFVLNPHGWVILDSLIDEIFVLESKKQ